MPTLVECINDLNKMITPNYLQRLPDEVDWLRLKTPLANQDDEIKRLCELVTVINVIKEAEKDANKKNTLIENDDFEIVPLLMDALQKIKKITAAIGNKDSILDSTSVMVSSLATSYFKKNPAAEINFEAYIEPLKKDIDSAYLQRLPDDAEWRKLTTPLASPKDEVKRLCELVTVINVIKEAEKDANKKNTLIENDDFDILPLLMDALQKIKKITAAIGNKDSILKSTGGMVSSLAKSYFENQRKLSEIIAVPNAVPSNVSVQPPMIEQSTGQVLSSLAKPKIQPVEAGTVTSQPSSLDAVNKKVTLKQEKPGKGTHYDYLVSENEKGRFHAIEVSSDQFQSVKDKYGPLKGDHLKSKILLEFKSEIQKTSSIDGLDALVKQLKSTDEYKVLKEAQGLTTKFFKLDTSSIKAFKKMVEDQEESIKSVNNKASPK